jgi:hypothetical protein
MEKAEIVTVSQIAMHPVGMLDPLVKLVQVEVSKPLAREVADRCILPAVDTVDDIADQPQGTLALDLAGDNRHENVVVDGWVELGDVHFQAVAVASDEFHRPPAARVDTLARDAGIGIADEKPLPYRHEDAHEGMLDDAVRVERQPVNKAVFRHVDHHCRVRGRRERALDQDTPDPREIRVEVTRETHDGALPRLPAPGVPPCHADVLRIRDLLEKSSVSFHGIK